MELQTESTLSQEFKKIRGLLKILLVTLGGVVGGIFLLAYFLAGEIYEYQDTVDGVHLPEVDAIVCLAGGRGRIAGAGDIWYRYQESKDTAPTFYISGMGHQSTWAGFRKLLRTGVRDVIRQENVVLETESTNTEANARLLARYAKAKNWKRILLITSPYHMRRSRMMFERVSAVEEWPLRIETISIYQEPFDPSEWRLNLHGVRVTLSEYFKWIYYRFIRTV